MFQDLFEYFKVYTCFFWWFGAIPKCSWGCSHLAAWLSPQTSMGWAFFRRGTHWPLWRGTITRTTRKMWRRSFDRCRPTSSPGASESRPPRGQLHGGHWPCARNHPGVGEKIGELTNPIVDITYSFFPWPQLGEVHGSRHSETPTLRCTLSGDLLGFRSLKMRKVHTSSVRTRIEQCCWKLRSVGIWFDM